MFLGGGAAKKAIETESTLMRADGTLFDGHIRTSAVDPSDLSKGFVSAISDISSRKRNEERLRDTEVRFNAFLSCSPIAAYMKDDQDRFVYANDKLLNQFDLLDAEETKGGLSESAFPVPKDGGACDAGLWHSS